MFALNALLAACALAAFTALMRRRDAGASAIAPLAVLAGIGGLLVGHHHTLVLLLLPLALAALAVARPSRRGWIALACGLALGLLPLHYLPWAAGRTPPAPLSWGDPVTTGRFARVLTRGDYGTFQLQSRESGLVADRSHVALFAESLPRDFTPWGVALAAIGLVVLLRDPRRRALGLALLGFAALQAVFFTRVGFPTTPAVYLGVVERFWILPGVVVALLLGVGVAAALARLSRPIVAAAFATLALAACAAWPALRHAALVDQRDNRFVAALADGVLASAPDSCVLFVQGDLFHNALAVRHLVEGARPDLVVLDQEMMTYAWYVARTRRLHPGILPPRLGAEDRYDGTPASGNVAWLDHLFASGRPVAFLGLKERQLRGALRAAAGGLRAARVPQGRGAGPTRARRVDARGRRALRLRAGVQALRSVELRVRRALAHDRAPGPRRAQPLRSAGVSAAARLDGRIPRTHRRARALARGRRRRDRARRPRAGACPRLPASRSTRR